MIAFVRGTVSTLGVDAAVVDVGGVGIKVLCSPGTLGQLRVGAEATLSTSMVVREDSLTLFGFGDDDERGLFELVQSASGVGPKLAQAMLAVHGPDELRRAVLSEDLATLCTVPGIGRKGAQRIVLELKDRIGAPSYGVGVDGRAKPSTGARSGSSSTGPADGWRDVVRPALIGLGWSAREADGAVDSVTPIADEAAASGEPLPTAELLRAALRALSRA